MFIITGECFFIITWGKFQHLIPIILMWWRCSRENKSPRSFHNILITSIVGVKGSSHHVHIHLRIDHKLYFCHEGLNRIISVYKTNSFIFSLFPLKRIQFWFIFPLTWRSIKFVTFVKGLVNLFLSLNMYFNWKEKWIWNMEGDSLFRCMGSNVFMM